MEKHIDYESKSQYIFTLKAWFQQIPSLSSMVNIEVNINDVNDHTPIFLEDSYFQQIDENIRPGTFVLQTFAKDKDKSKENSKVLYRLVSNTKNPFAVNSQSGVILVNGSIDYEVCGSYSFYVIAEDSGVPTLSSKVKVQVNISNLNDNAPVISDYNTSVIIQEGKLPGSTILKLTITDRDSPENAAPFKCLLLTGDSKKFEVSTEDGDTCVIRTKELFSVNERKELLLQVRVTDSG